MSDAEHFSDIHFTLRALGEGRSRKIEFQEIGRASVEKRITLSKNIFPWRKELSMKRIRAERTIKANLPFSDAVWHGDTLYLSGHIGLDPKTGKPGATPEEEARLVLDGIKRTLEAAGLAMENLFQSRSSAPM
jgi:enamine deaminase RidA (YjgF/YER057c/UK114 family)